MENWLRSTRIVLVKHPISLISNVNIWAIAFQSVSTLPIGWDIAAMEIPTVL